MNKKKQRAKDVLRQATAEEINSAIDNYFSREPLLTPRLKNWEEDLPGNNEKQVVPGKLIQVTEINDTWMETPRYENIMWGGAWLAVIVLIIPLVMTIGMPIAMIFSEGFNFSNKYNIAMVSVLWGGAFIFYR